MRICDLDLEIQGSELEERVETLYRELESRQLLFRPKVYLGDEWFSPEGVPSIAIPFFLAHPRLKKLEEDMMLEAEGGTFEWCMKILRHETGHCLDHAYQFSRRKRWQEIFGSPAVEYAPETYRPRPYSKSFVHNLDNWYAQSHPDEDFAETFAVWLNPEIDWREEYSDWPGALEKLEYVDHLMQEVKKKKPRVTRGPHLYAAHRMKKTLEKYYSRRKKEHATEYPDFYDSDLRRIFCGDPSLPKREYAAARFMQKNRKEIVKTVAYWTKEKKYAINSLVRQLTERCAELDLRTAVPGGEDPKLSFEIAAYLATLVMHHLFTGEFKRSL